RAQHLHRRRFAHLETENLKPGEWKFIECPKF
ncbi:16S rRNA pseudouridine(516) synthase, partial [Neisseria gonorrhoeae]